MEPAKHNLLLADDDTDDCIFFKEVLEELRITTNLTIINDGVELLSYLSKNYSNLPDVLFLDLNMPLKNGFECLSELKMNEKLKHLPVVIFSTSFDMEVVNSLYEKGANYYVRKPAEFIKLKKVVQVVLDLVSKKNYTLSSKEDFILLS